MSIDLNCISLNVRGLNAHEKCIVLFDWLRDTEYDIICLQETHFIKSREFVYYSRWNGKIFQTLHIREAYLYYLERESVYLLKMSIDQKTEGFYLLM